MPLHSKLGTKKEPIYFFYKIFGYHNVTAFYFNLYCFSALIGLLTPFSTEIQFG